MRSQCRALSQSGTATPQVQQAEAYDSRITFPSASPKIQAGASSHQIENLYAGDDQRYGGCAVWTDVRTRNGMPRWRARLFDRRFGSTWFRIARACLIILRELRGYEMNRGCERDCR
jgi:hypothetical protein